MRMRRAREASRAFRWRVAMFVAPWDDPSSDPHRFVVVNGIALDEGVAGLVGWCWENGIETFGSCEGSGVLHRIVARRSAPSTGFEAYISVGTVEDALTVADELAPFEDRVPPIVSSTPGSPYWFVSFSPASLRRWQFRGRVKA